MTLPGRSWCNRLPWEGRSESSGFVLFFVGHWALAPAEPLSPPFHPHSCGYGLREFEERRLEHGQEAEKFYRELAVQGRNVRVGTEASMQAASSSDCWQN